MAEDQLEVYLDHKHCFVEHDKPLHSFALEIDLVDEHVEVSLAEYDDRNQLASSPEAERERYHGEKDPSPQEKRVED